MPLAGRDKFFVLYERLSADQKQQVELFSDHHFCRVAPDDCALHMYFLQLEKQGWAQRSMTSADAPDGLWPNYWFLTQQGMKSFARRLDWAKSLKRLRNTEGWALLEPVAVLCKFALLFTFGLAALTLMARWICDAAAGCNEIKYSSVAIVSASFFWFSLRLALPVWFRFGARGEIHNRVGYSLRVILRWRALAILSSVVGVLLHLGMVVCLNEVVQQPALHDEKGAFLTTALLFGLMVSLAWWGLPRLMVQGSKDLIDPRLTRSKRRAQNSR